MAWIGAVVWITWSLGADDLTNHVSRGPGALNVDNLVSGVPRGPVDVVSPISSDSREALLQTW